LELKCLTNKLQKLLNHKYTHKKNKKNSYEGETTAKALREGEA